MSFANAHLLWMIPAVLILCGLGYFYGKHQQKRLAQWVGASLWKKVIPGFSKRIFVLKNLFLALSLFLIAFSIARPQWGEHEEVIHSQGMDVLFLVDLSNSMLAEDVAPSRLNRTQTFIKKTLDNLPDDRVGVVAFAGSAYLAAPLTNDFGYLSEIIDSLSPTAISNQGTQIGNAIEVGIGAFERGAEDDHKNSRAFVLVSDGEDFGDDAIQSAEKLKKFGAGFFVYSVGLPEGAPIPIRNDSGVLQTYKKDRLGKPIISKVNRDLMAKIANAGGGKFAELVNADDAAYSLSKQLSGFNRTSNQEHRQVTKIDRYPYFLALGILFFLIHLSLGYSRRRPGVVVALATLSMIPLMPTRARAQSLDSYLNAKRASRAYHKKDFENSARGYEGARRDDAESPELQFNEGTALAKGKRAQDALFNFEEATKKALSRGDYETAAKSLYNEGLTQSEQKNLPEAYNKLTKSIEMSKISNQPDLEKKARQALVQLIQKQKQQSQQQKNQDQQKKQDQNQSQNQKNQNSQDSSQNSKDSKNQKNQKDQDGQKNQQNKNQPQPEDGKQRQFKSGTLSKDVAESIMNDLSDREKQLYQKRMKQQKSREAPNDKDW